MKSFSFLSAPNQHHPKVEVQLQIDETRKSRDPLGVTAFTYAVLRLYVTNDYASSSGSSSSTSAFSAGAGAGAGAASTGAATGASLMTVTGMATLISL